MCRRAAAAIVVLMVSAAVWAILARGKRNRETFGFAGHELDALSLTIGVPCGKEVEGGLRSVLIFHGPMCVEPESRWRDGTPATASL